MPPPWPSARGSLRHPAFSSIAAVAARLPQDRWPSHDALTALAAEAGVVTATGRGVRFVPPPSQRERDGLGYEARIAATGAVVTRPENWHDLLNALAWLSFPRAKAALSAAHEEILRQGGPQEARRRSPARDALTLFDEGGVVVLARSPEWRALVEAHEWKRLFWARRAELAREVRVLAFGHALMESLLTPYAGITARALFLPAGDDLLGAEPSVQLATADAFVAQAVARAPEASVPLVCLPLPVLGLPGWHTEAEHERFYDDTGYFRPRRRGAPAPGPARPLA